MVETLEPILAKLPFFKGLDKRYLELLVGCASNARYNTGEYLYQEGKEANQFFIIRQGKVAIESAVPGRGMITVEIHEAGDVVGWAWLLPPYRWYFNGRAVEPTRVIVLDGLCLRGKCEQDHTLGYEFMSRFLQKTTRSLDLLLGQVVDLHAAPEERQAKSEQSLGWARA
jgi:CRP/FNR family cyclic AMP-dependent transcriptional regulator